MNRDAIWLQMVLVRIPGAPSQPEVPVTEENSASEALMSETFDPEVNVPEGALMGRWFCVRIGNRWFCRIQYESDDSLTETSKYLDETPEVLIPEVFVPEGEPMARWVCVRVGLRVICRFVYSSEDSQASTHLTPETPEVSAPEVESMAIRICVRIRGVVICHWRYSSDDSLTETPDQRAGDISYQDSAASSQASETSEVNIPLVSAPESDPMAIRICVRIRGVVVCHWRYSTDDSREQNPMRARIPRPRLPRPRIPRPVYPPRRV